MIQRLLSICLLAVIGCSCHSQEVFTLYRDSIPGNRPGIGNKEIALTSNGRTRLSKVTQPTLTMYRAKGNSNKGTAVIICPGGGYVHLASTHEGVEIAQLYQEWGITAFVLKYRLPDDTTMRAKELAPLQDAQQALMMVRQRANEWGINESRIGIMGFSAGGHVAATASTHFTTTSIDNPLAISLRPDFSVLIYPVISFTDSLAHMGSRVNLIGKDADVNKVRWYSNELQVTAQTPPAFLVHAGDDKTVKVANSIKYYEALINNNVKAEMHLYQAGGHGFGLINKTTSDHWSERLKNWLLANGWL